MAVMGLIGFLIFFGTLFYIPYFFIARIKNKEKVFPKKKFLIVLTSGLVLFIVALSLDDIFQVSATQKENRALIEDVKRLNAQTDKLNIDLDELEKEIDSMTEENNLLQEDLENLSNENKELKSENKELTNKIEKLKLTNNDLKNENEKLKEVNASSNSINTEKSVETKTSNSNETTQASNAKDESDCNIKGSENGIYHVPGSTYYNRTTNVVEWFCSEEEAMNAGYRAPKR